MILPWYGQVAGNFRNLDLPQHVYLLAAIAFWTAEFKTERERGCRAGWRLVNLKAADVDVTSSGTVFLAPHWHELEVRKAYNALLFLLCCNSKATTVTIPKWFDSDKITRILLPLHLSARTFSDEEDDDESYWVDVRSCTTYAANYCDYYIYALAVEQ